MAPTSLSCKECKAEYPLDARYVCEACFGPLEVSYETVGADAAEIKRKIQAGSAGIWRYCRLPALHGPPSRSARARADAAGARRPPG